MNIIKCFKILFFTSLFSMLIACTTPIIENTTVKASNKNITIMGRSVANQDGSIMFSYPGVTFSMEVNAKALNISLQSSQGNSYIDIAIDGQAPRAIKISKQRQNIEVFASEKMQTHKIVVQHRSESWHGTTTFHDLTIKNGTLLSAPTLPKHKLLFIGDSITCGDAIDREMPLSEGQCNKSHAWWNAKQTFGMLLSEKFNAQAQLICYGGRGVIRTWEGQTDDLNAEDFYELAIPELAEKHRWKHEDYQANLAVIALGTNDFSGAAGPHPERKNFVESYQRLINKIRADHTGIKIVLTDGPMLNGNAKKALRSYLKEIEQHYNKDEVMVILANHNPGDSCDYHPNKDQHKVIADEFYQPLKTFINW